MPSCITTNVPLMHRHTFFRFLLLGLLFMFPYAGSTATKSAVQERADCFLALANAGYQAVYRVNSEAQMHKKELSEVTVRQLKQLLLNAAEGPMTNPELVAKRVAAETKQASLMNGLEFKLNGQK